MRSMVLLSAIGGINDELIFAARKPFKKSAAQSMPKKKRLLIVLTASDDEGIIIPANRTRIYAVRTGETIIASLTHRSRRPFLRESLLYFIIAGPVPNHARQFLRSGAETPQSHKLPPSSARTADYRL